ncbi:MAG: 1-acyl-sn-glycerol-3-phosphate acyltransferase [Acidobacteria bacterium]|nr:1-acyl-sn-glycerol-3-phosphate acyltransferase [Acidobacteriota bacterium]
MSDAAPKPVAPMSFGHRLVYRTIRVMVTVVGKVAFRYEIRGAGNIPEHGAFILAPVHRSILDTPMSALVTPRIMRYMGKDSLWETGALASWFFTAIGGFPINRDAADRSAIRSAEAILERGEPLVMFPEGTRQSGPLLAEIRDGTAFLAARAQVPIIPVGIGGSERIMPVGSKLIYPRKLSFVIGEPIEPPESVDGRVPRSAVRAHSAKLAAALQELFDEAQMSI